MITHNYRYPPADGESDTSDDGDSKSKNNLPPSEHKDGELTVYVYEQTGMRLPLNNAGYIGLR